MITTFIYSNIFYFFFCLLVLNKFIADIYDLSVMIEALNCTNEKAETEKITLCEMGRA